MTARIATTAMIVTADAKQLRSIGQSVKRLIKNQRGWGVSLGVSDSSDVRSSNVLKNLRGIWNPTRGAIHRRSSTSANVQSVAENLVF